MGYATGRATGSSANTQDLEIGPQSSGSTLQTLQDVTRTGRSCVTASRRGKPQNSTTSNFISESINEIGKMTDSLGKRGINDTLPPMSSPFDIFEDLVEHALREGFRGALQALAGRRVKFATMCSGTESPILACRLVADGELRHLPQKDHPDVSFSPVAICTLPSASFQANSQFCDPDVH